MGGKGKLAEPMNRASEMEPFRGLSTLASLPLWRGCTARNKGKPSLVWKGPETFHARGSRHGIRLLATQILVTQILLLAPAVRASEPWVDEPFTADAGAVLQAAAAIPAPPGSDVHVLFRDSELSFDEDGRLTFRQRLLFQVLTQAGAEGWSVSQREYAPWYQERPTLRVRVLDPDGREHVLAEDAVVEEASPDPVSGRRRVQAPLVGVVPGAVVEEETLLRDAEPCFAAGCAGVYHLPMYAPIHHGRLALDAPTSLALRYVLHLAEDLRTQRQTGDGRVRVVFEHGPIDAAREVEPGLPGSLPRFPHVAWSTGRSWQDVAVAYEERVEQAIGDVPAPPEGAVADLERIAGIVARLHAEVSTNPAKLMGPKGGPWPVSATLQAGAGASEDKAVLLVARLREAGIPAHVALLAAGFGKDVDTALPGLGRFDHALVVVAAMPPVWIDPADPVARPGELPVSVQNRWALVASAETEKLVRTPAADSVVNLTQSTREVFLADHGASRIVERSVYHGEAERQARELAGSLADEAGRQRLLSYVESSYLARDLGEVQQVEPADLSRPFEVSLEALECSRAVTDLSEAVVAIRTEDLLSKLPRPIREGQGKRAEPFVFPLPYVTEWRYRIVPPAGFLLRALPEDAERHLGSARYTRTARENGGEVELVLRFDSGPRVLTAEQFVETRRAVLAFLDEEPLLVWFDHAGASAMASGRPREAIGIYREMTERKDATAIHHIRLAQALIDVGLGLEARREALEAVRLKPDLALAHWVLGFAREHDAIGRRFSPGFDREGAVQALERAVELEPENPLGRTELAILLEYNEEGKRYGEGADLDRAIEEYRVLRRKSGTTDLDVNLLSALFWARKWRDLLTATAQAADSASARTLRLVALSLVYGPDAAIRELDSRRPRGEERMLILSSAAQQLMIAREYPPAAALLTAAARNASNASAVLGRARLLENVRRHEDEEISAADPPALARSLILLVGRQPFRRSDLEKLFHPLYLADREREDGTIGGILEQLSMDQGGEMPADAVTDLALGVLTLQKDGDAERGYRFLVGSELRPNAEPLRVYVTRYEDRWVIAALDRDFGQLGKEVLRRLEQRDLKGASQWLDWARDVLLPVRSEDPYAFEPFGRFWTRGTGAFVEKMRLGAAILMANQPESALAVPILEEALSTTDDEDQRRIVEVALLKAYETSGEEEKASALLAELLRREPSSAILFVTSADGLLAQGRAREVEAMARQRLELYPGDPQALRYLARAAMAAGDAEAAKGFFEQIRDTGWMEVVDYERWSWLLLFEEDAREEALELAERGAAISTYTDAAMLDTLATVYAEAGRPLKAHQTFLQVLELRGGEDPEPTVDDALLLGRIAEEYGYFDAARHHYSEIEPLKGSRRAFSAYGLARRNLAGLGKRHKD